MAKRYAIWDKASPVITPTMEVFTAEQWLERYPAAKIGRLTAVCSAGDINGGFFGILSQMVTMYEGMGADFSEAETDEDKLDVIEAFEDARNTRGDESTAEERIAAALELANVMNMPSVNTDDPDED